MEHAVQLEVKPSGNALLRPTSVHMYCHKAFHNDKAGEHWTQVALQQSGNEL